jgi:hypothetical protein
MTKVAGKINFFVEIANSKNNKTILCKIFKRTPSSSLFGKEGG